MKKKFMCFCKQNVELKHLDTRRQRHEQVKKERGTNKKKGEGGGNIELNLFF
jgi:hypothetical protein